VLLLHAWWGLTPVFRAACDRLAGAGFVTFAPDLFGGETAATIDEAQALAGKRDETRHARATGALAYLRGLPGVQGSTVGLVGFSLGGGWASVLASEHADEVAAVALFYDDSGLQPATRAAVIGHYGDQDEFADVATIDQVVAQWRSIVPDAVDYRYPGAHHWFAEENQPGYYDAEATELAWSRTIDFLASHLKA
jgi:carboxymethylenebutenolidase